MRRRDTPDDQPHAIAPYEAPDDAEDHEALGRPFRVVARLRNNRLIRAREELGLTCKAAAAAMGAKYETLIALEGLKRSPWNRWTGDWTETARKVASYYGYSPEELWPDVIKKVRETVGVLELASPTLTLASPEDAVTRSALRKVVAERLAELRPRERQVLEARFGLAEGSDEDEEKTLLELADDFDMTREGVRQIECKALRKLREPYAARHLQPFKDPDAPPVMPVVPAPDETCLGCGAIVPPNKHHPRQRATKAEGLQYRVQWVCDRTERRRLTKPKKE